MKTLKNVSAIVLFAAVAAQIHTASAEPSKSAPQASATPAGTVAAAVAVAPELPLLRREASSLTETAAALKGVFCQKGCTAARLENGVRLSTGTSHVDVTGDGSLVDFVDTEVASRALALGRETSQRTSEDALEKAGRKVLAEKLSGLVQLAPSEELYPILVSYRTVGGQAPGEAPTTTWTGSRIVFGRKIGGVPVVGGGSTFIVTFANDGSLESFHYDWARYTITGENKPLLPMGNILSAVQATIAARSGLPAGDTPLLAPDETNPGPIDLSPTAQLEGLECGYYDPGQISRDAAAPVQPGCAYRAVSFRTTADVTTHAGYAGAVPASSEVVPDASWPEAAALTGLQMSAPPAAPRIKSL